MYIPTTNLATDKDELMAFMKKFSFATIVSVKDNIPIATHLPFLVTNKDGETILISHFAKANEQWKDIEDGKVLVIFSEPHAYISPKNYDHELNVPTWNYISVHAYGRAKLIPESEKAIEVLEATIDNFEASYRPQWDDLPEEYKMKMLKGIIAFEIIVTELQGKKKLSQNRTASEKEKIIETLSKSENTNEKLIAGYIKLE